MLQSVVCLKKDPCYIFKTGFILGDVNQPLLYLFVLIFFKSKAPVMLVCLFIVFCGPFLITFLKYHIHESLTKFWEETNYFFTSLSKIKYNDLLGKCITYTTGLFY